VLGELFEGAFRSENPTRHVERILERVLPTVSVLPYDAPVARTFGRIQAALARTGRGLADADAIIAATAVHHGLTLVTGNIRHFGRVPGLRIDRVLANARAEAR
jgi:predicted nucleic acid-binding protein